MKYDITNAILMDGVLTIPLEDGCISISEVNATEDEKCCIDAWKEMYPNGREIPQPIINPVDAIMAELEELDTVLPRCVEDIIIAAGIDTTKLPQVMQDRLVRKQELRTQLQNLLVQTGGEV
jgi:hypothetical protein